MASLNLTLNPVASLTIRPRFQFGSINRLEGIVERDSLTGASITSNSNINLQSQFGSNLQVADFNGDGIDDLAVTAPEGGDSGQTFIYLGTSNELIFSEVLDETAPGVNNVEVSGDFNGDGIDDLALAQPDSGLSGQVIISFGNSNGLSMTQTLDPTDLIDPNDNFLSVTNSGVVST
ncbi:MAG: FG-GAP-like repeat-containing protein [Waterburya sp.]